MKKLFCLFTAALLTLSLAGCQQPAAQSSGAEEPSAPASLPQEELASLADTVLTLLEADARILSADWVGRCTEEQLFDAKGAYAAEVLEATREGNTCWVTVELYGDVCLDPHTLADTPGDSPDAIVIRAEGPYAPYLAFGTALLELRETAEGPVPISCDYTPYDQPGLSYLKAATEKLQPQLADSPKLEIDRYDPVMVDYVQREVLAHRYIASPAEITLWDMENLVTEVVLNYNIFERYAPLPENYQPDGEIFRLATGMKNFTSYIALPDYGIFEGMEDLQSLYLCDLDLEHNADFSTLHPGGAKILEIKQFRGDLALDLTGSQVEHLALQSDVAGVTAFTGCESVKTLSIEGTTTDMTLLDRETFPALETLQISIFSDTPRLRDFSQLATFGEEVEIHLSLNYQACNDATLATLEGVHLASLALDPWNGPWPQGAPDPEILAKLDAENLTVISEETYR